MLFERPTVFDEAIRSAKAKAILPTTLSHAELAPISKELAQVALASARVYEGSILSKVSALVEEIVNPAVRADGTFGVNLATARAELKEKLRAIGYQPPEGERGRITDLSSDQRLNLIVQTQADQSRGFGQWKEGLDQDTLDMWPAQRLFRAEPRIEPRDWDLIWPEAAAQADADALRVFNETGDKVALKSSPIWLAISDFSQPFPPFKFNSGMWVEDVDRDEAIALGLLNPEQTVQVDDINFAKNLKMDGSDLDEKLREQILNQLGPGFAFKEGVLTRV